jgi:hypothetical protein
MFAWVRRTGPVLASYGALALGGRRTRHRPSRIDQVRNCRCVRRGLAWRRGVVALGSHHPDRSLRRWHRHRHWAYLEAAGSSHNVTHSPSWLTACPWASHPSAPFAVVAEPSHTTCPQRKHPDWVAWSLRTASTSVPGCQEALRGTAVKRLGVGSGRSFASGL